MRQYDTETLVRNKSLFVFFFFCIVLLYPMSIDGVLIYIPQFILGAAAMWAMFQIKMIEPVMSLFLFGLYMTVMSFLLSIINGNTEISAIFISSLRLFFPFLALMVGGVLVKKIQPKILLYLLVLFLGIELLASYLQLHHASFRTWSYYLYRPEAESAQKYLTSFNYANGKRTIGTVGNPNTLGILLIVINSSILILSKQLNSKEFQFILNIICTFATFYIIIHTQSRTALLLFSLISAFIIYWSFAKQPKDKVIMIMVASVLSVIVFFFIQSEINRQINFESLLPRVEIWKVRIEQIYDQALYSDFYTNLLGIGYHLARNLGFYDNIYLKIFVSAGMIGLFLFLMTIVSVYKAISKMTTDVWKQIASVNAILWVLASLVVDYQEIFPLATISFMLMGFSFYYDKEKQEEKHEMNSDEEFNHERYYYDSR